MTYKFDRFELDTARRELRRDGAIVNIEPQVFDLLLLLIRHHDRVVSKDELIREVWNGRIVSESALHSRIAAARQAIGDSGDSQHFIRTIARKGIRFVAPVNEQARVEPASPAQPPSVHPLPPLPEKPSIVVLPFANLSGDTSQDYFADGMVEDITIALGRLPWLFVIGSIAAFTYKNRPIDVREIGDILGVRYVLRGSVRKEGGRVRITAELTDAIHSRHIWADRFESEIDSVFELQDRVAMHVSAAIAPALQSQEIERARRVPTENLTAYDLFLQALPGHTDSLEQNLRSIALLQRAIETDPTYSAAYGLSAWCYAWQKMMGWVPPDDLSLAQAIPLAHRAAELGTNDSEAMWMAAQALTLVAGELDAAILLADKSLALNPNAPNAWWARGVAAIYFGGKRADEGLDCHQSAGRLNPVDPWAYYYSMGMAAAHFFTGRFAEAVAAAEVPLSREPRFVPALRLKAAAYGMLNKPAEGRLYVERLLAASPNSTVDRMRRHYEGPLRQNPQGLEFYLEGLRRSGLPEGS